MQSSDDTSAPLRELLLEELKDLYSAEQQLAKALPKLARAAADGALRKGISTHLKETEGHVDRLEEAFEELGVPARAKLCKGMKGLIEEGNEASEFEEGPQRDAYIVGAAQRVEHYEIAAYGTVRTLAEEIGERKVASLLQKTLDEEGRTDKKLTAIAKTVNRDAGREGMERSGSGSKRRSSRR